MGNDANDWGSPLTRSIESLPMDNIAEVRPSNRMSRYNSWFQEKYSATKDRVVEEVLPLLRRREILLGVAALVVAVFARPVSEILLQYMSVRFHWKFSKAAILLSYQAALRLISFSALFPAVHFWINSRLRATETTDLTFGIWSSCITVIGLIGIGISTTWVGVMLGKSRCRYRYVLITGSDCTIYHGRWCCCGIEVFCHITSLARTYWPALHHLRRI